MNIEERRDQMTYEIGNAFIFSFTCQICNYLKSRNEVDQNGIIHVLFEGFQWNR